MIVSGSSQPFCKPFIVDGKKVGQVPPYVFKQLENVKEVFTVKPDCVELNESLKTFEERTKKINQVMATFRDQDAFVALKGWRNEVKFIFILH